MIAAVLLSVLVLVVYSLTLAPTVSVGDSGELITAAHLLGVAHPPGYPLYTLLGKVFLLFPKESPAWSMNVLSAIAAAGAVALLFAAVRRLTRSVGAGLVAAFLFAFSSTFWSQATIAEVYALSIFLLLAPLLLLMRGEGRCFLLASYLAGTGAAHHPMGLFFLPVYLMIVPLVRPRPNRRLLLAALLLFLFAWTVFLALVLRARSDVCLVWGDPSTFSGLLAHVGRAAYGGVLGVKDLPAPAPLAEEARTLWGIVLSDLSLPAVLLSMVGVFFVLLRWKGRALPFVAALLLGSVGVLLLINLDKQVMVLSSNRIFFLPLILVLAGAAGAGAGGLAALLRRPWLALLFLVLPASLLLRGWPVHDRSGDFLAADLGRLFLEAPERGATLRVTEGQIFFPLLYLQQVEGVRRDIRIEATKGVFRSTAQPGGALYYASRDAAPDGTPLIPQGILFRALSAAPPPAWKEEWDHLSVRPPPPPALGPMEREVLFGFHLRYAANLAAAGRKERAGEELMKARPLSGGAEEGVVHLARAYHEAGFPREALDLFQSIAAADPGDWRSRLLIGAISEELGETAAAREAFRQVCRLAPERPEGYLYLARLQIRLGDREGARESAAKGIEIAPGHPLAGEVRAALGEGLSR